MRRFVLKLGVFLMVQLLVALPLMLQYRGVSAHFFAATNEKHELARTAPGPRLIIVGGSNAMYPFDSARIHYRTGYHPVNMSRLAIGQHLKHSSRVQGSAFGLTRVEANRAAGLIGPTRRPPTMGEVDQDALLFLRSHRVLW